MVMYDNEFETKRNKITRRGKGFILSLPSPRDCFTLFTNRDPVHRLEMIGQAIDHTTEKIVVHGSQWPNHLST